jgi:molybdenum cofactor synthesis domain-containing protein
MTESRKQVCCEIIAIGNELLIGDVQDTNTYWLIQQLTGLGGQVRLCSIVRDDIVAIAAMLRESVAAQMDLVITSGGLGPTGDDLTLAAVAEAFDLPVVVQPVALELLTRRYAELAQRGWVQSGEMTEARRKMAIFPAGAEPLLNPAGGAPGALLKVGGTTIVSLPGVPRELKAIFSETMGPLLNGLFGGAVYRIRSARLSTHDESSIAATLQFVVERNPKVYLKSRAIREDGIIFIRVSLSAAAADGASTDALLDEAWADLVTAMAALGILCQPEATTE